MPHCLQYYTSTKARGIYFEQLSRRQLSDPTVQILESYGDEALDEDGASPGHDSGRCIKRIHIFSNMELFRHIDELKHFTGLFKRSDKLAFESDVDCTSEGYACDVRLTIGLNISMIRGKDAVVFGMVGTQWRRNTVLQEIIQLDPEPGQTWIYFSTESPYRIVRWSENLDIARLKYHVLMTYDSNSEIHIPFGYYRPFNETEQNATQITGLGDEFYNRTGLISWVASNCRDVFWPRMPFISRMLDLMPLDDYGACGHKECLPKRSDYCNRILARYKFYLATPNSECNDYITEKFWLLSLKYGTVPVVLGARREDYERVAPPNSFVHFADFESFEEVADYLQRVSSDDDLYRKYHEWRRQGEVVITYPTQPVVFCRALPHIHVRQVNDFKYLGDSPWYTRCREIPNRKTIKLVYRELANWSVWK